jgi:hypothetical protein
VGAEREHRHAQLAERRRRDREGVDGRRRALKKAIGKHAVEVAGTAGGLASLRALPGRLSAEVAVQLGPRGAGDTRVTHAIGKLTELTAQLAELASERRQGEPVDARPSTVRPPMDIRPLRPPEPADARVVGLAALPQVGTPIALDPEAAGAEQAARVVERELRRRGVGRRAIGAAALVQDAMHQVLRALDEVTGTAPAAGELGPDELDAPDRAAPGQPAITTVRQAPAQPPAAPPGLRLEGLQAPERAAAALTATSLGAIAGASRADHALDAAARLVPGSLDAAARLALGSPDAAARLALGSLDATAHLDGAASLALGSLDATASLALGSPDAAALRASLSIPGGEVRLDLGGAGAPALAASSASTSGASTSGASSSGASSSGASSSSASSTGASSSGALRIEGSAPRASVAAEVGVRRFDGDGVLAVRATRPDAPRLAGRAEESHAALDLGPPAPSTAARTSAAERGRPAEASTADPRAAQVRGAPLPPVAARDAGEHPRPRAPVPAPARAPKAIRPAPVALDAPPQGEHVTTQPNVTLQARAESPPAPALAKPQGPPAPPPASPPAPSARPAAGAKHASPPSARARTTPPALARPAPRVPRPAEAPARGATTPALPDTAHPSAASTALPAAARVAAARRPGALERPATQAPAAASPATPAPLALAPNAPAVAPAAPVIPAVARAGGGMPEPSRLVPATVKLDGDRAHAAGALHASVGQRGHVPPASSAQRATEIAPLGPELRRQVPTIEAPARAQLGAAAATEAHRTAEHDRGAVARVAQDGAAHHAALDAHAAQTAAAIATQPRPAQLVAGAARLAAHLTETATPVAPAPTAAPVPDAGLAVQQAVHASARASQRPPAPARGAALTPPALPPVSLARGDTARAAVVGNTAQIAEVGAQMRGVAPPALELPARAVPTDDVGASAAAEAGVPHPPSRAHAIAEIERGIAREVAAQAPAQVQRAGQQLAADYEGQAHADHGAAAAQVTQATADGQRARQEIEARPSPVSPAQVDAEAHARWATGEAQATQASATMQTAIAHSEAGARSATTTAAGQRTASVAAARTAQTTAVTAEQGRFHASQAQAQAQLQTSQAQAQTQLTQQQAVAHQTAQQQTAQAHAQHAQQVSAAQTASQAHQAQARAQHDHQVTSAQTASAAHQQQLQTASDHQVEQQHAQLQQRTDQLHTEGQRQVEAHLRQGEQGYQGRIQQGQSEADAKLREAEAEAARKRAEADAAHAQQGGVVGAAVNWVRDRVNDLMNAVKAILEAAKAAVIAIMEAARAAAIAILEAARQAAQAALQAIERQIQAVITAVAAAVRSIIAAAAAAIRAAIQALAATLQALVQALTSLITSLIAALQQAVNALLDALVALVAVFDRELASRLDAATQGFRRAFDQACDTMKRTVEQAGAALEHGIQRAAAAATAAVDRAEHALQATVTAIETQLHAAVEQAYHAASQAIDAAFAAATAAVDQLFDAAEAAVTAYVDAQIAAVSAVQAATNWAFDRAVELADKAMVAISKAAAWVVAQLPDAVTEGFLNFWNGPWRSTILIGLAVVAAVAFTAVTGGAGGPLAVMLVAGLVGGTLTGGAYLAGEAVARQGELHLASKGNGLYVPNLGYVPLGADGKPDLSHVPKDKLQDVDWAMSSFKANGTDRAASGLQMERGPDGKLRPVARSDREIGSLAFSEGVKGFGEGFIAAASAAGGGAVGGMVSKAAWLTKLGPVGQRILAPLLSKTVEGVWQVASNSLTGAWDAGFQAVADGRGPVEAFQEAGKAWLHGVSDPGQLGMTLATMVPIGGRFGRLLQQKGVGPRLLNTLVETGKMTVGEVGGNFLATYAMALHGGARPEDALHQAMAKAEEALDPTKLAINLAQTHAMGVVHERFASHEVNVHEGLGTTRGASEPRATSEPVATEPATRARGVDEVHGPERAVSDRAVSERPLSERAVSERAVPERPLSERAGSERAVSERPLTERAVSERAIPERPLTERPLTERPLTERPLTERAVSERAVPERAAAARDEIAGAAIPELDSARAPGPHASSDAEVRQMTALREQLREMPQLEPAHWERLTPGERHQAIARVAEAAHAAHGIPEQHRPTIELRDLPAGQGGWADWPFVHDGGALAPVEPRGRIVLNENLPVGDAVRAALHESRHMFQMYEAWNASLGQPAHPHAAEWQANQPGQGGTYHDPAIDHARYRDQPIERDAERFARQVADPLPADPLTGKPAEVRDTPRDAPAPVDDQAVPAVHADLEPPAHAPRSQDEPAIDPQRDAPAAVRSAIAESGGQLGPELGRGGFGSVHEVVGHPDLVVKVPIEDIGGKPNGQLVKEAASLRALTEAGVPTPYRGMVEWVDGRGVQRTGIVMERIDGAFSKNVLQTGKLAGETVRPEHRAMVNERTVADLEALKRTCVERQINIEDLQFMIAPDGSIRVIDPARVELLADSGLKNRKIRDRMDQFQRRIDRVIAATREIATDNRTGRRITASAVPGSEFRGGSAPADRARAAADAHAAFDQAAQRFPGRIERIARVGDGYVVTRPDGSVFSVAIDAQGLGGHTNAHTRIRPTAEGVPLRAGVEPGTEVRGHYVIEVSDTLEPHQVQRAIDHELAEIMAVQEAERAGRPIELDSLRPGPLTSEAQLSPHDEGRIAELNHVVARLDGSPARQAEVQALIEHLGLRDGTPGADQRRRLIDRALSPEARVAVDELRRPADQLPPEHRATLDEVRARAAADVDPRDPMSPYHALPRELRAQPPAPILHDGVPHDVMGVSPDGQLRLRDARAPQRDVRIESLPGREVDYRGERWQIGEVSMSSDASHAKIELRDPRDPGRRITVTDDVAHVELVDADGQRFQLGGERHGIVRMSSLASRAVVERPLHPGDRFEARLRGRELEGVYQIEVATDGSLVATGHDRAGNPVHAPIAASEIAPRYEPVRSSDYRADFDVDAFAVREDAERGRPAAPGNADRALPIEDELLGNLREPADPTVAVGGIEQLDTFEAFIQRQLDAPGPHPSPRKLTLFNISMSTEGHATRVLDAMVEFRRRNPDADMRMVVYALGKPEFQGTPEYRHLIETLRANRIHVDQFRGDDASTRQVIHAKGVLIDDRVLFSTGAVIDAHPKNKADINIELPPDAAASFRRYTEEAIEGRATPERRQQLAEELARHGVLVNDPVAGLPYIARAHDALILGARRDLIVMVSELQDPRVTRAIIQRAAEGVQVTVQHRGLDPESQALLEAAQARYPGLRVEGVDGWDPRPHFNLIIADRQQAYVGSSYLWPTQRNMIHHGRSLENGVLLEGAPVEALLHQLGDLDRRARGQARVDDSGAPTRYDGTAP